MFERKKGIFYYNILYPRLVLDELYTPALTYWIMRNFEKITSINRTVSKANQSLHQLSSSHQRAITRKQLFATRYTLHIALGLALSASNLGSRIVSSPSLSQVTPRGHTTCVDGSGFYIMHYQTANFRYIRFTRRVVWEDLLRNEILGMSTTKALSTKG